MNTDMFIYNKMPRKSNYGQNIKSNTILFIHEELFNSKEWITYNSGYLLTYLGLREYLLEMALITNLAYTYRLSGEETYEISPYYHTSLYKAMDWKSCLTSTGIWQRLTQLYKTSRLLKEYFTIEERGRIFINHETRKREYIYTKYKVTEKLKELASKLTDGKFIEIDLAEILDLAEKRTKLPCMKEQKLYIVHDRKGNEVEFSSLREARVWSKENECGEPILIQTPNRVVRMMTLGKYTFHEVDTNKKTSIKDENKKEKKVSITNTVKINRAEIEKILSSPTSGSLYSCVVMEELMRMYDETTDDNQVIELKYFESYQGRHYTNGSTAQMFPKELRERIFSDYVAVDMECSIFSLYKNLGKKYGYKEETPEIDKMLANRRAYRDKFVNSRLPYDGVKTILTAIAYGAVVDIYNMYMEINDITKCFRRSSLLKCGYDRMAILEMCNTDEIISLKNELKNLGKFIISKCTDKDKKCIFNLCGNPLSTKTRHSFGVKMAHIYQSYEAAILMTIRKVKIGKKTLDMIPNGIGLYLHDGLYVKKSIVKKYDLCSLFSQKVKEVFDFDIKYELEV